MCMFKALHKDPEDTEQHRPLSKEEFYRFYEVLDLTWIQVRTCTCVYVHVHACTCSFIPGSHSQLSNFYPHYVHHPPGPIPCVHIQCTCNIGCTISCMCIYKERLRFLLPPNKASVYDRYVLYTVKYQMNFKIICTAMNVRNSSSSTALTYIVKLLILSSVWMYVCTCNSSSKISC